ncbi:MAG: PAS domain S-box protein [Verrucomicrobiia bacterium]|jgi:PAS domain S-box-containing protein
MKAVAREERQVAYPLVLIYALLAAGIVTIGCLYYRHYERHFHAEAERQLSAVAELKVDELVQYRKERLWDAGAFFKNTGFSGLVRRFFEHPEDADAQDQIQEWAAKYLATGQYDLVCLFDAQGVVRLSVPAESPISSFVAQHIPEVLRSGQVTFQDFHRNEQNQQVYLTLLVPIFDGTDHRQALGVFALRIDPETYLYPFIRRWPVPSETAETLLVRRDGNDALFLNELKFRTNTALNLRISLENTNIPAVKAVLGQIGIVEGTDYRGEPVLAALQAIPDSPWFLVARMDAGEIYAPLRSRLKLTILCVGLLLISLALGIGAIWRQQRVRFYREKYEIEAERAKLSAIVECSEDAIIGKSLDGTITSWNTGAEHIYGYAATEAIGQPITLLIPPGQRDELPQFIEKIKRGDSVKHYETERIHKNGGRIQMSITLSPVKDVAGEIVGISVIGRDITERKRAEEKLKHTLADLERSNRELEQFAYVASHDLQEPLRMVSSYTQLLAKRYEGRFDDKAKKYVRYAVDGAIRMQTLINDLLAYSRVGSRGRPPEPTDSHSVLGEAVRNLAALIEENRAVITNDDLPMVRADASQLALVFQNLVANAIKFRRQDLPRIHVSAQDQGREWVFAVQDNGIGIEPRHAERVFVLFQRLHTREEYPGTGIGLAVCKRIVERHGGKIWLASEPGNGSTFFFTIPK